MRGNKNAILGTTGITFACFMICIALYNEHNLFYDLSLACFGSSLLGIVVSTTAYRAERRDAMEHFLQEARKTIPVLSSIPIIEIPDIVRDALIEEDSRLVTTSDKRDILRAYIEYELPTDENTSSDQIDEWIENMYQSKLEDARTQLKKGAEAYIAFAEFDLSGLSDSYGRLDFFCGNNEVRKSAYYEIYDKIRTFRRTCLDKSRVFKQFLNGNVDMMVCIEEMLFLQSIVFENRDGAYYAKFKDELLKSMETFRSKIYNIEPEYAETYPVEYMFTDDNLELFNQYMNLRERSKQVETEREESAKIQL